MVSHVGRRPALDRDQGPAGRAFSASAGGSAFLRCSAESVENDDPGVVSPDPPVVHGADHSEGSSSTVGPALGASESRIRSIAPMPTAEGPVPLTLHLDNVDVRQALEMLSREGPLNLLVSPGVSGSVTADLQGLSPDETLNAILSLCGLVARREENLIFVFSPEEYPRHDRELRVFSLDYVSAADALAAVQSLLSPVGNAIVLESAPDDHRKNRDAIVAEDTPYDLARIATCIAQIDQPPRQVLIQVHVLEVDLAEENRHGVNFGYAVDVLDSITTLEATGLANPLALDAFFVNVDGEHFNALVEALKTTTDAKTLASPKVLVVNGQEAHIQVGEKLGYRVITSTDTASMEDVEFLELGVVLTVTPHISHDGRVLMSIKPEVSSGVVNPKTGLPEEETTEVETAVSLCDGQGVVIGGLIQESNVDNQKKIPWLGDLWMVGRLFQHRFHEKKRSEIIIALLPRIMPYPPADEEEHQMELDRATSPLLQGPLCPYPRPYEPSLDGASHLRADRSW